MDGCAKMVAYDSMCVSKIRDPKLLLCHSSRETDEFKGFS